MTEGAMPQIHHSDVEGGYAGEGNIDADPLFVDGPEGDCCLSQLAAGQPQDSPCLDAGISTLISAWLNGYTTTRTDGVPDTAPDDIGYHYSP